MTPAKLPLVVVHDSGDPAAGGRWAALSAGWGGPVLAPDLPGHGTAPSPVGGSYAPGDAALVIDRLLRSEGIDGGVVGLGHGWGGFAIELLASAGRLAAAILVDGLGGPWATPEQLIDDQHRWLRAVFADPAALAPPPPQSPGRVDPRLAHGYPDVWERAFTEARRATIAVPVLALESPASTTPPIERHDRLASFAGPTRHAAIGEATAEAVGAVLAAHRDWLSDRPAGGADTASSD